MEILSLRDPTRGDATAAYVSVDGVHECHSIEDPVREPATGRPEDPAKLDDWVKTWKVDKVTAIITGRFRVTIDMSTRFKKLMIHILNVPGWDGIRAHGGLNPEQTEGCPLLGDELYETDKGPRVRGGQSTPAVERLFKKIEEALARKEEVWWTFAANPNVMKEA